MNNAGQIRYNLHMGEVRKSRLAILIGTHGRGSNMAAIADACAEAEIPAEVAVVVAPERHRARGRDRASKGLEVAVIPYKAEDYAARAWGIASASAVRPHLSRGFHAAPTDRKSSNATKTASSIFTPPCCPSTVGKACTGCTFTRRFSPRGTRKAAARCIT